MKKFSHTLVQFLLIVPVVFIEALWYFKFLNYPNTKDLMIVFVMFHFFFLPVLMLLYRCAKFLRTYHEEP